MVEKVGVIALGKKSVALQGVLSAAGVLKADDVSVLGKQPFETARLSRALNAFRDEADNPHC